MAELGLFDVTIFKDKSASDTAQVPATSISVKVYKEGAWANGSGSIADTASGNITVHDTGSITTSDTLQVGTDSTITATINSITGTTTINVTAVGGAFAWSDASRIVNQATLALYSDDHGVETGPPANPLTTDSTTGRARAYVDTDNVDYIISGTGVTTTLISDVPIHRPNDGWMNVRDFGAKGDGSTDDSAAIQAAINYAETVPDQASNTGGKALYFPSGNYKIVTALTSAASGSGKQAMRFIGEGGPTHNDSAPYFGSALVSATDSITLWTHGGTAVGNNHQGPVFENLNFVDGGVTGNTNTLLKMRNTNRWTVRNCSFRTSSVGLHISGDNDDASWGYISQCGFTNNDTGVLSDGTDGSFLASGGWFDNDSSGQTCIKVAMAQVRIIGIKIDGAGGTGIDFADKTLASEIIGCTLEGCANSIKLNGSHVSVFTENQVVGCNITGDGTGTAITIGSNETGAKIIGCRISNHTTTISDSGTATMVVGVGTGAASTTAPYRFNTSGFGYVLTASKDGNEAFNIGTGSNGFSLNLSNAAAGADATITLAGDTSGEQFQVLNENGDIVIRIAGDKTVAIENGNLTLGKALIYGTITALADDATPTVLGRNVFLTGGTTTITDFDDGVEGQIITVIAEHSLTITEGTNIFLSGSANFDMTATDTLSLIQKADGKWYETGRGDNGA